MVENINYIWIGFTGMALSFLYRVPQTVKIIKTKNYKDISKKTIHIQNLSYVFYVVYAYLISDPVNIASSCVSALQNFFILYLMFRYSRIASVANPESEKGSSLETQSSSISIIIEKTDK